MFYVERRGHVAKGFGRPITRQDVQELMHLAERHFQKGRYPQVQETCRQILLKHPTHTDALLNLGVATYLNGDIEAAVAILTKATILVPNFAEAYGSLGRMNAEQGEHAAAAESFQRALALKPENAEWHFYLGVALFAQAKLPEAIASYRKAVEVNPNFAEIHNNLGTALVSAGCLSDAIQSFHKAIALKPDFAVAWSNLGGALVECGEWQKALENYDQAILLQPDVAEPHLAQGRILLLLGRPCEGWPKYEWRRRLPEFTTTRSAAYPSWNGSSLEGKTLLLSCEQGLGDSIQFIRYAALLKERSARIVVECPVQLKQLFADCSGIDILVTPAEPLPAFDVQVPLMSVPYLLGGDPAIIPAAIPYLQAPSTCRLEAALQAQLTQAPGLKVGLVWSPNLRERLRITDLKRYCPLAQLKPLLENEDISLFSLYKGDQISDLEPYQSRICDLGSHFHHLGDTAWVIERLNLVISVDTAVAHLAGAMGKPVWILLPYVPDWRWFLHREESPWYPTARLFRQREPGNWDEPVQLVLQALEKLQTLTCIQETSLLRSN
jgi:tetratricopeptide (TPR) repeat protein